MVEPITLVTLSLITFVVSCMTKNPFFGSFTTFIFEVIWFSFFSDYFILKDPSIYFIHSTLLILVWGYVGGFLANTLGFIPVLDPFFIYIIGKRRYGEEENIKFSQAFLVSIKALIFFILLILAHIPLEFDTWTPLWKPSLTTACFVLAVFITAFFMFNIAINKKIFLNGSDDVNVIFLWMGGIYIITLYTWLILYSIPPLHKFFIVQYWNFYLLLIFGGVVFLISVVIKFLDNKKYVEY